MCWGVGVSIQRTKSSKALEFSAERGTLGSSSQVKDEIGYASAPGGLVIETRKSVSGPRLADAPAGVTLSSVGSTKAPVAVCSRATGRLLEVAWTSSTYSTDPFDCFTTLGTPSFPLPPRP